MLKFISNIFNQSVNRRNKFFDSGRIKPFKCTVPVISVGNLSVGGTGKTPMVQYICRTLLMNGIKPAIIGKGYKRKSKGEVIVCNGEEILSGWLSAGDEMYMLAESLMLPVVVHDQKYLAAQTAALNFDIDCIVVDDGFQHRKLHRDLDIVLLTEDDIRKPFLLPRGRLREPLESMKRADVVCIAGTDINETELQPFLKKGCIISTFEIKLMNPYLLSDKKSEINVTELAGKRILAVSGIANPSRFYNSLVNCSLKIENHLSYPDHYNYQPAAIKSLIDECQERRINTIAITEKDSVKLKKYQALFTYSSIDCFVFPVEINITSGKDKFDQAINSAL